MQDIKLSTNCDEHGLYVMLTRPIGNSKHIGTPDIPNFIHNPID